MRTPTSSIDHESLIKQSSCYTLGIPIEHINIITRLANTTWFADIVQTHEPSDRRVTKTPFLTESGPTLAEALINLHVACSKETHRHYQTRGFKSGPDPENENDKEESEDEDDDLSIVSASSSDDEDTLPSRRSPPIPRVVPNLERPSVAEWPASRWIPKDPRGPGFPKPQRSVDSFQPRLQSINANARVNTISTAPRPPPGLPRLPVQLNKPHPSTNPFLHRAQSGNSSPVSNQAPNLTARIRIDFQNHGTVEIAETIPMTPGEILTAATRHCDMLTGAKCLRASLKSVTRGGTKICVQGCVLNLAGVVGALPNPGEVPVFEVEVTKGPAA